MARPKKIKRYGNIYGGRNSSPGGALKVIAMILGFLLIVAVGYFLASKFLGGAHDPVSSGTDPVASVSSEEPAASDWQPSSSGTSSEPDKTQLVSAVQLPQAMLSDPAKIKAFSEQAKADGYTSVLVPMKDQKGNLLYASKLEKAAAWKSIAPGAVDAAAVAAAVEETGLIPIARIYAFADDVASNAAYDNAITYGNTTGTTWLDNAKERGGKSWLNPYKPAAREYICEIANELITSGFKQVLVDGIQFPSVSLKQANLQDGGVPQDQILKQFIQELEDAGNILVAYKWSTLSGLTTSLYGGDPTTYGEDTASPVIDLSEYKKGLALPDGSTLTTPGDITTYLMQQAQTAVGSDTQLVPVIAAGQQNDAIIQALKSLGIESYIVLSE